MLNVSHVRDRAILLEKDQVLQIRSSNFAINTFTEKFHVENSFTEKYLTIFLNAVAPECKPDQRIIYGAAFKSEVTVSCYVEANPMPHSFKWQFKTASKRRRTDLINTVGGAKALDDIKDMVDLPANQYTLEYDHRYLSNRQCPQ